MKRTINVTTEDIINGKRFRSDYCPIALAAKRDYSDLEITGASAGVSEITLYSSDGEMMFYSDMPRIAKVFVSDFDMKKPVKPISFEIELKIIS